MTAIVHKDTGAFIIEEHTGEMFSGPRFSLDERFRDVDGVTRLVNIGWYGTLDKAMHALMLAAEPVEEIIAGINAGPA